MKVLLTGVKNSNADNLGRMLGYYGIDTLLVTYVPKFPFLSKRILQFKPDLCLVFGVARWHWVVRTLMLPCKIKIYRPQGTDVYVQLQSSTKRILKYLRLPLVYASKDLKPILGLEGEVIPTPIDTTIFEDMKLQRTTDVLYYCRNEPLARKTFQFDRFMEYIKQTGESYTIVGKGFKEVKHKDMPRLYNQHKKLIRYALHDANPKMPYEALLCGCEVWYNDQQITEVPDYMLMEDAIPKFIALFEKVMDDAR